MIGSRALLVLAGPFDAQARAFSLAHAQSGARLVAPRDLSREGWSLRIGDPLSAVAVSGGERLAPGDIRGVVTRIAAVREADIPHIDAADRAYVAAEMSAFLLAFLVALPCRVSNRPTSQCLCGPGWAPERWRRLAKDLGVAAPDRPSIVALGEDPGEIQPTGSATVVGQACFGDLEHFEAARRLAIASGADMLTAEFDGGAFLRASPFVDLALPGVAEAALALFDTTGRPS